MLKSIAVVLGSYVLSIAFVLATDPLSRLFPGDFVKGRVPSNQCSDCEHGVFCCRLDSVRMAMRPFCSEPYRAACALVLRPRRSDGHRCHHSQLEQGLATLVLAVVAAHLAGELLDRPDACRSPE